MSASSSGESEAIDDFHKSHLPIPAPPRRTRTESGHCSQGALSKGKHTPRRPKRKPTGDKVNNRGRRNSPGLLVQASLCHCRCLAHLLYNPEMNSSSQHNPAFPCPPVSTLKMVENSVCNRQNRRHPVRQKPSPTKTRLHTPGWVADITACGRMSSSITN